MHKKPHYRTNLTILTIASLILFITLGTSIAAFAYFSSEYYSQSRTKMDINLIFGRLDASVNPSGDWGTENNPYLISENQHLINLYTLQNRSNRRIINEDSVFQVSNALGQPVYIGSLEYLHMLELPSIGTEIFPFTSTIRGVRAANDSDFIVLPSGEKTDTSTLGNIKVMARPGQIDIGLFGNVGPLEQPADGLPQGDINTLLLYNISIDTDAVGAYTAGHKYFVSGGTYETNHIGILAGHARYVSISNISAYYSGPSEVQNQKHVKAFDIHAGTLAKYTTSSGIIGHYEYIVLNDDTSFPVSSTGFPDQLGGANTGLGLGIVYSEDIWDFMETHTLGHPATEDEYVISQTFGAELYGAGNTGKTYFNLGVFTFAHSTEVKDKDKIAKIWTDEESADWNVSTTSAYTSTTEKQKDAKKYFTKRITNTDMTGTTSGGNVYHTLTAPYNSLTDYRYLITVEAGGEEYALVRYGGSAIHVKVDPTNFIIPESELNYYTFTVMNNRVADTSYPPYQSGSAYRYYNASVARFMTRNVAYAQYAIYGDLVRDSSNKIIEAPRPLRIFYLSNSTPSTTFNASSSTSIEGIHFHPNTNVAYDAAQTNALSIKETVTTVPYTTFSLERTNGTTGAPQNYYMTFNAKSGFSANSGLSNAAEVRLYAVRITNYAANPSQNPVNADYNKVMNTPSANLRTYDMRTFVLKYRKDEEGPLASELYTYDIQTIESLNWSDNAGFPLETVDTQLKMGAPTSYYYISGATNPFWGVTRNIVSPIDSTKTINVPQGSIGFTVNGTGNANSFSKVYVIVATNPLQDVNQSITISRFGTGNNQTGDRKIEGTFVLPPVPGATASKTEPIYVTDIGDNQTFLGYPNLNKLLVAHEFSVPSQYTITYFLEASMGTASFVYLSAERSAATDNNPTHENDVAFPHLSNIDFVYSKNVGGVPYIATVGSTNYVSSLTSMYFGVKSNPLNPQGQDPNIDPLIIPITSGLNFTYTMGRTYMSSEDKYYLYFNVVVSGYPTTINKSQLIEIMTNMNFNFSEWSYIDPDNLLYSFSDTVVMTINNKTITNWVTDLIP